MASTTQQLSSVEATAAFYGIQLPTVEQLPSSYGGSLRMWLNRRLAAIAGKNKRMWQVTKQDPERLQKVREANKLRAQAYRARHKVEPFLKVA
jgi:hypothetical protein